LKKDTQKKGKMKMLKVIFIHYTSDISGGSDKSLYELISSIDKRVIYPIMILKKNDPMVKEYKSLDLPVYELEFIGPPRKLFSKRALLFLLKFIPTVLGIVKIIKKELPNIIHVNTSLNIQGALAAYLSKVPLVWHNREILGYGLLDSLVKKVVCKLSTKTIAISDAVKKSFSCNNTLVVYNGMNLKDYLTLARNTQKDTIVVSCIGRFEEWKGQHILLEAIPMILNTFNNISFKFIGGPASAKPEYLESLKEKVINDQIDNVEFLGIRKDIPALLSQTDILVVPTATSEPFGRTVIEGMAAGCIVIATAAGGPLEIIDDKKTGYLVEPNNSRLLAEKLKKVIIELGDLEYVGQNAKVSAIKNYDIKRVSSEIQNIFMEVNND
jgi:glycosyltransferase involved in cell wall biosynthesis